VIAAQYGLDTLAGDVAAVNTALGRLSSPAILVGHSYGGTLITAAGTDPGVAALVYIAALAPDADETSQSQQAQFAVTDVFSHIEVAGGRVWLKPEGVAYFAGDLPEEEQKVVWATHAAPAVDLFNQKVEGTAWRSKPRPASGPGATRPNRTRRKASMTPAIPDALRDSTETHWRRFGTDTSASDPRTPLTSFRVSLPECLSANA
jgi:pimeloyl-ACP methyl ester carboxylesterase